MGRNEINKVREYVNIRKFIQNRVNKFVDDTLGIDKDSIYYSSITEEQTKFIIDTLIKKKNEDMEKYLIKGLEKFYENDKSWKRRIIYRNKDKFIENYKNIILGLEQNVFAKYNLGWFDIEFRSDYARYLVSKELLDLRDTMGDKVFDYLEVLSEMYMGTTFPRLVYEYLALRCKNANLNLSEVLSSRINKMNDMNKIFNQLGRECIRANRIEEKCILRKYI